MIDLVRYGIAMANAKQKLKDVAKYDTESNVNNGVAFGIRAILSATKGTAENTADSESTEAEQEVYGLSE